MKGRVVCLHSSSQSDLVTQLLLGLSCAEHWVLQKHADSLKDEAEALVSLPLEMQMRC